MDNLHTYIKKNKLEKYFHIAHSSYALYYAKNQNKVFKKYEELSKKKGSFFSLSSFRTT